MCGCANVCGMAIFGACGSKRRSWLSLTKPEKDSGFNLWCSAEITGRETAKFQQLLARS